MSNEKEQTNGERFEEFMRTVEGYPELEGTQNLCNDMINKRTGKMTEEEWQAAERAQIGTKQETAEDAAKEYMIKKYQKGTYLGKLFIAGAKWQKEQEISDEEMTKLANEHIVYNDYERHWIIEGMKLYREQLKTK